MQDMATMQQHSITSPAPATTISNTQDSPVDSICNAKCDVAHQEASRTEAAGRARDSDSDGDAHLKEEEVREQVVEGAPTKASVADATATVIASAATAAGAAGETAAPVAKEERASPPPPPSPASPVAQDAATASLQPPPSQPSGDTVCHGDGEGPAAQQRSPVQARLQDSEDAESTEGEAAAVPTQVAKGFGCRECGKVLSSAASLDRHVLVHSGERPFKCRVCGLAFTTNCNMRRHLRTHGPTEVSGGGGESSDGGSSDSGASPGRGSSPASPVSLPKKRKMSPPDSGSGSGAESPRVLSPASDPGGKRKAPDAADDPERRRVRSSPGVLGASEPQRLRCPRCGRDDAPSLQALEAHMEEAHPECGPGAAIPPAIPAGASGGVVRCQVCDATFKNPRALNIHRFTVHREPTSPSSRAVIGFKDLTFVDFSSEKFPHIARMVCERSLHRPTSVYHRFQCDGCGRAFPCGSALDIHRAACGAPAGFTPAATVAAPAVLAPTVASPPAPEQPTDLTKRSGAEESEEELEERKRDDFFAGLDLRNKSSAPPSPDYANHFNRREERFENALYFNAVPPVPPPARDLADIQSIISVTASSGGMLQDLSGSAAATAAGAGVGAGAGGEEEQQDDFAAEFRRMKLKGEFPCRLCTAVFPNLRALKGHNRTHLSGGTGPFRCNMCPFAHSDKTVLVRHLRTHNGDRPYECALCNYAFTTKANCERHLRNRHSKITREEVKKSIIYHPSEDPTNDPGYASSAEGSAPSASPAPPAAKRALIFGPEEAAAATTTARPCDGLSPPAPPLPPASAPPARPWEPQDISEEPPRSLPAPLAVVGCTSDLSADDNTDNEEAHNRTNIEKLVSFTKNSKPFTKISSVPSDDQRLDSHALEYEREANSPLDLSMDALDLSKKRESVRDSVTKDDTNEGDEDSEPQDLSKKKLEFNNNNPMILAPAFAAPRKGESSPPPPPPLRGAASPLFGAAGAGPGGAPKMEVSAAAAAAANLYASRHLGPLFSLNNNGLPFGTGQSMGSFQSLPFFLPTVPQSLYSTANHQEIADMKERLQKELIRGLQLTSGGSLLDPRGAASQLRAFHNQVIADSRPKEALKMEIKDPVVDVKPLVKPLPPSPLHNNNNINSNNNNNTIKSGRERDTPGAVKMVIKNGVLMPKQKQRRYRTERPFACEHCSARFTLRSNMERHVKQQHPQFWSQRQRGATAVVNGPGRRPTVNVPIPPLSQHPPLPVPQPKIEALDEKKPINHSPILSASLHIPSPDKEDDKEEEDNNNKAFISDEVRLLIAQQLKSKLGTTSPEPVEEDDGDGELVIDEEKAAEEDSAAIPVSSSPLVAAVSSSSSSTSSSPTTTSAVTSVTTTAPTNAPAAPAKTACSAARPQLQPERKDILEGGSADLASVSRLLDNASTQTQAFQQYFRGTQDAEEFGREEGSEEDEDGLVAGSNSEGNNSGSDENKSESEAAPAPVKKKSAYSLAPNRVSCPFCYRKFPWSSSLRRHVLTHTGQKPFKCPHCPLLFTTKSNCDRHLLRKHSNNNNNNNNSSNNNNNNSNSSSNNTANNCSSNSTNSTNNSSTSSSGSGNETSPGSQSNATASATTNSSNNYTMRNVPERPYKCNYCPSSTFASLSNLRKHVASKHSNSSSSSSPPTSPMQQHLPPPGPGSDASGPSGASSHYEESHCGSGSEDGEAERRPLETTEAPHNLPLPPPPTHLPATPARDAVSSQPTVSTSVTSGGSASSELPFKCHLCDGGYADRQDALDHLRDVHPAEFELLMSKGALDTSAEDNAHAQHTTGSSGNHEESSPTADENLEQLRGRFPDYANRKVMCAFCMRRFWSAEDLRRHMRTHTGERPFSCDICRRRFTLKHSMLRHRKKHAAGGSLAIPAVGTANTQTEDGISAVSGDEEAPEPPQASSPSSSVTSGFAAVNHNNNNIIASSAMTKAAQHRLLVDGANTEEETDLIGHRRYCQNEQLTLPLTQIAICHANLILLAKHTQSTV